MLKEQTQKQQQLTRIQLKRIKMEPTWVAELQLIPQVWVQDQEQQELEERVEQQVAVLEQVELAELVELVELVVLPAELVVAEPAELELVELELECNNLSTL
jgi:hypothetical protein